MDKAKVDEALRQFANALPEPPKWVILLKEEDGGLLSHTGNFRDTYLTSLTPDEATRLIHSLAVEEIEVTDALKHGNFQFSFHFAAIGAFFIVAIHGGY